MQIEALGLKVETRHSTVWVLLALCVFVFVTPNVDLAPSLSWHDGQRLAQLVLLAVVTLIAVSTNASSAWVDSWLQLPVWVRAALASTFAIGLLSSVVAVLPAWALLEWAMFVLLTVLALLVAAGCRAQGESADRLIVVLFFLTATAYADKVFVYYLALIVEGPALGAWFDMRDFYSGFSNIRFFGHLQTMILPFLLLPAMWWGSTMTKRSLLMLVPMVWWMLVSASGSRGTWAGLLVGLLAVLWLGGAIGRRWCKWQLLGLAGGMLLHGIVVWTMPLRNPYLTAMAMRETGLDTLSRRDELWTLAVQNIADHPWLGLGPMHFAYAVNPVAAHPHSALLQFLVEWGVPATMLLATVLVAGGAAFAKSVQRNALSPTATNGILPVALLAALSGSAAQTLIDGVMVMPVSQTMLALLCGWALAHYDKRVALHGSQAWRWRIAGNMILLCVSGMVAYGVWPDVADPSVRETIYYSRQPSSAMLMPRFWVQGWISE